MAKQKQIDVEKAIRSFIDLPDWQERTLVLGGLMFGLMLLYILLFISSLIPLIGFVAICLLVFVFPILAIFVNFYIDGYKLELVDALVKGKSMQTVPVSDNYSDRIFAGAKLGVANLFYNIPLIILYVVGYFLFFAPILLLAASSSTGNEGTEAVAAVSFLGSTILFYVFILIGWVWQMFQTFVIYPVMFIMYRKERSLGAAVKVGGLMSFVRNNAMSILLYTLIMFGFSLVFGIIISVSAFTVFLCVGIVLLPIVFALGMSYSIHLQAELLAQMELTADK